MRSHQGLINMCAVLLYILRYANCFLYLNVHTDRNIKLFSESDHNKELIENYRSKAKKYADNMKEYFESAKNAASKCRFQEAGLLSSKGYASKDLMYEYNNKAAELILDQQSSDIILDLHGLYEKEARPAVIEFIRDACERNYEGTVEIITGVGHHSVGTQGPVLYPAIEKLCIDNYWKYSPGYGGGSIEITILERYMYRPSKSETVSSLVGCNIPANQWDLLSQIDGTMFNFEKQFSNKWNKHKQEVWKSQYAIFYIDTRKTSDDYKRVLFQLSQKFNYIHPSRFHYTLGIITRHGRQEYEKLTKKHPKLFTSEFLNLVYLLSDENNKFLSIFSSLYPDRLGSAVILFDILNNTVKKVWTDTSFEVECIDEFILANCLEDFLLT